MTITIGVPVFNGGAMLRECLTCLRDQTFRDFAVLIYDNASTDDTAAIAREFAASDARFTYFRQPENRGPAQNFIDVLEAASTPLLHVACPRRPQRLELSPGLPRCTRSVASMPSSPQRASNVNASRQTARERHARFHSSWRNTATG